MNDYETALRAAGCDMAALTYVKKSVFIMDFQNW